MTEQQNATRAGHRRSCQHDDTPAAGCPGCAEIDAMFAAAHAHAAALPPTPRQRGRIVRALFRWLFA